jgi:hypothetical protein
MFLALPILFAPCLHLRDGRDTADTQTGVFDYGNYTLLSENALWTPYMKKTEMAARDTDEFPDWTFCATKIEILGLRSFMYLGRHGDGWQVFDANHERIVTEPGKQADREHLASFLDAVRSR